MAELHIVGEIVGASGFEERNLFCKVRRLFDPSSRAHRALETPRTFKKYEVGSPPAPESTTHPLPASDARIPHLVSDSQWGLEAGSMWDLSLIHI